MGMVGRRLATMFDEPQTVATCQCGQIPYYLKDWKIVDLCALMNNELAHSATDLAPEYLASVNIDHFILYYSETSHYYVPLTLFPDVVLSKYFQQHYYLAHVFCHQSRFPTRDVESEKYMLLFSRRKAPLNTWSGSYSLRKDVDDVITAGNSTGMLCNVNGPRRGEFVSPGECSCWRWNLVAYLARAKETFSRLAVTVDTEKMELPVRLTAQQPEVRFEGEANPGFAYVIWAYVRVDAGSEWRKVLLTAELLSAEGPVKTSAAHALDVRGFGALNTEVSAEKSEEGDILRVVVGSDGPLDGSVEISSMAVFQSKDPR